MAEGTYTRNTTAVKSVLLDIRRAEPQVVVMVDAYKPCAAFNKLAHRLHMDPTVANISFVGSDALAQPLGRVARATGQLAAGDLDAVDGVGRHRGEIGR